MVRESAESLPSSALLDFKQQLCSILGRVERRRSQLDVLANLYDFYDSVSEGSRDLFPFLLLFHFITMVQFVLLHTSNCDVIKTHIPHDACLISARPQPS